MSRLLIALKSDFLEGLEPMQVWTERAKKYFPDIRMSNVYRVETDRSENGWLSELWAVVGVSATFDHEELVRRLFTLGGDLHLEAIPLMWAEKVILNPQMPIPHPDLHRRPVLLQCAVEVDSSLVHPILGQTLGDRLNQESRTTHLDFYAQGRQIISI